MRYTHVLFITNSQVSNAWLPMRYTHESLLYFLRDYCALFCWGVGVAQSVYRRATGWRAQIRFQELQRSFFFHSFQASSFTHPTSNPTGTGGAFLEDKGARAELKNKWGYISIPPYVFMAQCLINWALGQLYIMFHVQRLIVKLILDNALLQHRNERVQVSVKQGSLSYNVSQPCVANQRDTSRWNGMGQDVFQIILFTFCEPHSCVEIYFCHAAISCLSDTLVLRKFLL
jgi:hypothetical protein